MKKGLLGLLVILIIAVVGGYMFISTGKKVDVQWTEADYTTAYEKSSIVVADIEELNLVTLARGDFTTTGSHPVDTSFTNAEMSALIDTANANGGPISDFKVSFNGDNEGEMSFTLTDAFIDFIQEQNMVELKKQKLFALSSLFPLASTGNSMTDTVIKIITNVAANKPVYAKGTLMRTSDNSVSINITALQVGQLPMSEGVINKVETEVLRFVNNLITSTNGFTIEELRVEDGALYYKGTLPTEIQGARLQP